MSQLLEPCLQERLAHAEASLLQQAEVQSKAQACETASADAGISVDLAGMAGDQQQYSLLAEPMLPKPIPDEFFRSTSEGIFGDFKFGTHCDECQIQTYRFDKFVTS
mmetsp:Transcript_50956/g.142598  ORF Transcript_50956/g.142598 Transcript_50956/m.142598 type:complete len:107 (+) Transcript_50956:119-439(+)